MTAASIPPRLAAPRDTVPALLRYLDVVLVVAAAPILLLVGAPAVGYAIGAGSWTLMRVFGIATERRASTLTGLSRQLSLQLGYRITRVFLLAIAAILARQAGGRSDGLTALVVIVIAFTAQLTSTVVDRSRKR